MIYARHDFTTNFLSAVGDEDTPMKIDIVADEIARMIVDDKTSVVKLLRKNGINATYNDNNIKIANLISKALETNKDLAKGISELIVSKNVNEAKFVHSFSADAETKTGNFWDNMKTVIANNALVSNVSDLLDDAINTVFSKPMGEEVSEAGSVLEERVRINEMRSAGFTTTEARRQRNKKIAKYVLSAAIIGGLIYLGYKGYKKYIAKSEGVEVLTNLPTDATSAASTAATDAGKIIVAGGQPLTQPAV